MISLALFSRGGGGGAFITNFESFNIYIYPAWLGFNIMTHSRNVNIIKSL